MQSICNEIEGSLVRVSVEVQWCVLEYGTLSAAKY